MRTTEKKGSIFTNNPLFLASKLINKFQHLKNQSEEGKRIGKILMTLKYFMNMISDVHERVDFLQVASQYAMYQYYPRGAAVYHHGDLETMFGIVVQGNAYLYAAKDQKQIAAESEDPVKCNIIGKYMQYTENTNLGKKAKKTKFAHEGSPLSRKLKHSYSLTDILGGTDSASVQEGKEGSNNSEVERLLATILSPDNNILPPSLKETYGDLSYEEKLLIVNSVISGKKYVHDGVITYSKVGEVNPGECFSELSLILDMPAENTMIAADDLHVLYFTKEDYKLIFNKRTRNIIHRKDFLKKLFPDLSMELLTKVSYYLEERLYQNRQVIYEKGDEAKEIYFVKEGGVELIEYKNNDNREKVQGSEIIKKDQRKAFYSRRKLVIGNIQVGGCFGEDEVLNREKRQYTAKSGSGKTVLYVLRATTYYNIFEKYMPYLTSAFMSLVAKTKAWRQERKKKEDKISKVIYNPTEPVEEDSETILNKVLGLDEPKSKYLTETATAISRILDRVVIVEYYDPEFESKLNMARKKNSRLFDYELEKHRGLSKKGNVQQKTPEPPNYTHLNHLDVPYHKMNPILAKHRLDRLSKPNPRSNEIEDQNPTPSKESCPSPFTIKPLSPRPDHEKNRKSLTLQLSRIHSHTKDDSIISHGIPLSDRRHSRKSYGGPRNSGFAVARPQTATSRSPSLQLPSYPEDVVPQFMTEIPQTPLKSESINLFKRITGNMRKKEDNEVVVEYGIVNPRTFSVKMLSQASTKNMKHCSNEYELKPVSSVRSGHSLHLIDNTDSSQRLQSDGSYGEGITNIHTPRKVRPMTAISPRINQLKKSIKQIGSTYNFS